MKDQKFRKLIVWSKAMDFVELIYKTTHKFPTSEMYGLTSQIRRAATSIALNIAEGSGSGSDKEFCRFLNISLRSSYEVVCGVEVAKRLSYCNSDESDILLKLCDELSAMITGLKKSIS
jgi:four helix bundle protein